MHQNNSVLEVAVKELTIIDDATAIFDFQHEITIMRYICINQLAHDNSNFSCSKLSHENMVKLHGITISPLQMVLEYVPMGDLHHTLETSASAVTLKWKLKLAIDCASGMTYVQIFIFSSLSILYSHNFQIPAFSVSSNLP